MTNYFIIPGLGNSGPDHWQTYFEKSASNFKRINQAEWDSPKCEDWITAIDQAILGYDLNNVVFIAHSLGCSTVAFWAKEYKRQIKGALLVAPSDTEALNYQFPVVGFSPMPLEKINFKTIVVASADDVWVSIERARLFAASWGSEFIDIGNAGHINVASGHTDWHEGLEILERLT